MKPKKIANNYAALARQAMVEAQVPDEAAALVRFYEQRGDLDKVRASLARGVLQHNRPADVAWVFGSEEAKAFGFSLTLDLEPSLGITPLLWAVGHRRLKLWDQLVALGADPTYQHPKGPNAWRYLVSEAPADQAPPLALMGRMKAAGVPFATDYQHSAWRQVFGRRSPGQPGFRDRQNASHWLPALAWAEALLAHGFPPLAADELGQTPHHIVLGWAGQSEQQDPRRPWLALMGRYGGLAWDQPDHEGTTPRQLLAGFPELLAEQRAQVLAQPSAAPPTRRRPRA